MHNAGNINPVNCIFSTWARFSYLHCWTR